MACAQVPLDEQQVTEPDLQGKEHTLPALVSQSFNSLHTNVDFNSSLRCSETNPLLSVQHQHPVRKEERSFVPYKPLPEDNSPAEVEEFLEYARFIKEDLEWLLSLPHDKFWCQVRNCLHPSETQICVSSNILRCMNSKSH